MDLLKQNSTELLQSGYWPDLQELSVPLIKDSMNVYADSRGLMPLLGASLLYTCPETITGLAQASISGSQRAYIGGQTKGWYYTPTTLVEINNSMTFTNRMRVETWGAWAIFNSGLERPRLWKNTDVATAMGTTPFTTAQHMKRFKVHMLAANTSNDPNLLEWCSADDIESWNAADPANTAGNLFIRDLDGPINGLCGLGQSVALYSNETLVTVNYLGNAFVIGAIPTVRGIGIWGGEAVTDLSGTNFGFGPQGVFTTDGNSFDIISTDRVHKYIRDNLDLSKRELAFVWHNEVMQVVEFCFWNLAGVLVRLGYDYARKVFWPFNKELSCAIERQVFSTAIGASGAKLFAVNSGTSWDSAAISGFVESKRDDFGTDVKAKTINLVTATGDTSALTLTVSAFETPSDTGYVVSSALLAKQNWMNAEGVYFKFRLSFTTALVPIKLTELAFYGKVTGSV